MTTTTHKFKIGDRVLGEEGAHRTSGVVVALDGTGVDGNPYCGYHDGIGQDCAGPFYTVDVGGSFGESCYAEHELIADN